MSPNHALGSNDNMLEENDTSGKAGVDNMSISVTNSAEKGNVTNLSILSCSSVTDNNLVACNNHENSSFPPSHRKKVVLLH